MNRGYAEESSYSAPIPHLIFHFIFISFSLISVVLSKQVSYRYHNKRKSFINGLFTPFMKLCLLLKLDFGNYILCLIKFCVTIFCIIILDILCILYRFETFCKQFASICIITPDVFYLNE